MDAKKEYGLGLTVTCLDIACSFHWSPAFFLTVIFVTVVHQ